MNTSATQTSQAAHHARSDSDPAESDVLRRLLSGFCQPDGIMSHPGRLQVRPDDAPIHCHACIAGPGATALGKYMRYISCGGAGFTATASRIAAIGEGVERFTAIRFSQTSEFVYCSGQHLVPSIVPFDRWQLFSPQQYADAKFPCQPLTRKTKIKWWSGERIHDGAQTWLPGPVVAFPYSRRREEPRICQSTTTGLALGSSDENATRSALWEVIERDAIALAWNWGLPSYRLPDNHELVKAIRDRCMLDERYELAIYDITTDIPVPVCMAFIRFLDADGAVMLNAGSAARATFSEALDKAVLEALQGVPYVRFLRRKYADWNREQRPEAVRGFDQHAAYYSLYPERLAEFLSSRGDFLRSAARPRGFQIDRSTLTSSLDALLERGFVPYRVDMSSAEVRQLGFAVMRVVVPGLLQLEGDHRLRSDNLQRAASVASVLRLGIEHNPAPHPLP